MERMHGEQGGHQGAGPQATGHPPHQQEQQNGGRRVQGNVHRVVPAGLQPEQLAVEHVRVARQRMVRIAVPVKCIIDDARPAKAVVEMLVVVDVMIVVVVDEIVGSRLAENEHRRQA